MFKFGFSNNSAQEEEQVDTVPDTIWLKSEEIIVNSKLFAEYSLKTQEAVNAIELENYPSIRHVSSDLVVSKIKENYEAISLAEQNHSDLVTAVYEGGLKIWECTYDLIRYICKDSINFKEKKVLDLGCGAGLLGILAYLGQSTTYFQDYNPEVINYITIPNVLLNTAEEAKDNLKRCRFYSGDWKSFLEVTETDFQEDNTKFDYIFTSETIYNQQNYKKLSSVFKERLKSGGIIYLAAKTYYFGVGGSLREFEDLLRKDGIFECSPCWKCSEGVQREIIKITFKK